MFLVYVCPQFLWVFCSQVFWHCWLSVRTSMYAFTLWRSLEDVAQCAIVIRENRPSACCCNKWTMQAWMNEWNSNDLECIRKPTESRFSLTQWDIVSVLNVSVLRRFLECLGLISVLKVERLGLVSVSRVWKNRMSLVSSRSWRYNVSGLGFHDFRSCEHPCNIPGLRIYQ